MRAQDTAISSTQSNPEQHISAYNADPRSFGGRYIAADLFKETFSDTYASSREARNVYNTPVHNSAAVLSSEQFRRVLERPDDTGRGTVIFLTGIPGAGKTSSILTAGALPENVRAVFGGQLVKPETTIPKIQQVIDAELYPVIMAVHATPEDALRNTLQRFTEEGRGASIGTMSAIQGGLPDGLEAVRRHFGEDAVALTVVDYRDRSAPRELAGWDKIQVLASEGNRENIATRLGNELDRLRVAGHVTEAAYRQAAGRSPLPLGRGMDEQHADRREEDERGRGLPQDDRAKAFLTLPAAEVIKKYPELAGAYSSLEAIERKLLATDLPKTYQAAVLEKVRLEAAERINKDNLPNAVIKKEDIPLVRPIDRE